MALEPLLDPGQVRMVHSVTGSEAYASRSAYRDVWYHLGWRSPLDDPTYDGTDPSGAVSGRRHVSHLDDLADVDLTAAAAGHVLVRQANGVWAPAAPSGGLTIQEIEDQLSDAYVAVDSHGIAWTVHPATVGTTVGALTAANQARWQRVQQGHNGTNRFRIVVGTSSGNISVASYGTTGVGVAAAPGARTRTSGAIPCPSAGAADVSFTGGVIDLRAGEDWLGLSADNTTATFARTLVTNAASAGFTAVTPTSHPLPDPSGAPVGNSNQAYLILGVTV